MIRVILFAFLLLYDRKSLRLHIFVYCVHPFLIRAFVLSLKKEIIAYHIRISLIIKLLHTFTFILRFSCVLSADIGRWWYEVMQGCSGRERMRIIEAAYQLRGRFRWIRIDIVEETSKFPVERTMRLFLFW